MGIFLISFVFLFGIVKMPRPHRIEFSGAFYHVYARGNNKQKIFRDEQDYNVYLDRIERYYKRFNFVLYAYALMSNHIHFAIETNDVPLSKIMQGIQHSYSLYVQKKYKTVGHLYQGPYGAVLYEKEASILKLVQYIHRNPVEACIVENPAEYPWCSHSAYLNLSECSFLNKKTVLEMFPADEVKAIKIFNEFVFEGPQSLEKLNFDTAKDRQIVGSEIFVETVKSNIKQSSSALKKDFGNKITLNRKKTLSEILKIVSKQTKVSADSILGQTRLREITEVRRLFAFVSAKYFGYRLVEIAKFLKLDATAISKMVRKVEDELKKDPVSLETLLKIIHVFHARPRNED